MNLDKPAESALQITQTHEHTQLKIDPSLLKSTKLNIVIKLQFFDRLSGGNNIPIPCNAVQHIRSIA